MAKQNECAAWLKKAIKIYQRGVDRSESGDVFRETVSNEMQNDLTSGSFRAVKTIKVSLDQLALYYGMYSVQVINGDANGWRSIDHSIQYHYWNIRFAAAVALMQLRPEYPEPFNAANTLFQEMPIVPGLICYAIVHDLKPMRDELWSLWRQILNTRGAITDGYWGPAGEGKYELFSFRLFAQTPWGGDAGLPLEHRREAIGPYAHLFDAWERPEAIVDPLRDACDYHCRNTVHANSNSLPIPFETGPFGLVPYEILAIYKLREQAGLATPEIDHPLMQLATASRVPRQVHAIDDPAFPKLEALFNKHCQPFWSDTLGL